MRDSKTLFYKIPDQKVREELDSRAANYLTNSRSGDNGIGDHNFTIRKKLWWKISVRPDDFFRTIDCPEGPKAFTWQSKEKGFALGGVDSLHEKVGNNFIPWETVNSIKVSTEGSLGILRRCELSFTCFSIEQFERLEKDLMSPGVEITVEWGWTVSSRHAEVNKSKFQGIIFDFSWSLTAEGGFECSVQAKGKGEALFGASADLTIPARLKAALPSILINGIGEGGSTVDFKPRNIIEALVIEAKNVSNLNAWGESVTRFHPLTKSDFRKDAVTSKLTAGYKYFAFGHTKPKGLGETLQVPSDVEVTFDGTSLYTSLENIIDMINEFLVVSPEHQSIAYRIDPTISRLHWDRFLYSSAPWQVILPSYEQGRSIADLASKTPSGKYFKEIADKVINSVTGESGDFYAGYILIGLEWLITLWAQMNDPSGDTPPGEAAPKTGTWQGPKLTMFIDKILEKVNTLSGGLFNLGVIMNPDNDKEWWIVDRNNHQDKRGDVYKIPVLSSKGSVVRSVNLSAKLPDAMQTTLYVGQRSNAAAETVNTFLPCFQPNPNTTVNVSKIKDIIKDNNVSTTSLNELLKNDTTLTEKQKEIISEAISEISAEESYEDLKRSLKSHAALAWNTNDVEFNASISALREYNNTPDPKNPKKQARHKVAPYPLELSLTLDGIDGFVFGDIISITYLPQRWSDDIVFMIKSVTHEISNDDWVTSISTQARLTSGLT